MKKNISINISGIIFHIEEDGYLNLKTYLESINRYFSTYDDSSEIISDIESRIAEIFLSKLSDGKQVITLEDVSGLIQTMGTIADFDAVEYGDEEATDKQEAAEETESASKTGSKEKTDDFGKKTLYRDDRRKVLGGVAAGIAYYFSIDPLWIRLVMLAMLLNVFILGFSGAVFLAYIVLWMVIPVSTDLGDQESVKKMFRDPENQVLGGIASGIAAYFGIDVTVVRLLFVVSIFLGGSGLVLYIILWMITPVAKTITEKMQMQGEPVTLSNIQQSVTRGLKTKEGEESTVAKILLFPFRVIAEVFRMLGKLIGPISKLLVDIVRIAVGILITLVGMVTIIALFATIGIALGLISSQVEFLSLGAIPVEIIPQSFSLWAFVSMFILAIVPVLMITLLGISLIVKRLVISSAIGWSALGVWFIGLIVAIVTVPNVIASFHSEGQYKETREYKLTDDEPLILKLGLDDMKEMKKPDLVLRGGEDSLVQLIVIKESRGSSRSNAIENAQMVAYEVSQFGNNLIFDANFQFKEGAKFRGQTVDLILYIPEGKAFVMERYMREILPFRLGRSDYNRYHIDDDTQWMFTDEGLTCITCEKEKVEEEEMDESDSSEERLESVTPIGEDEESLVFDLKDFNEIEIDGIYRVFIEENDTYKVVIKGSDQLKKQVQVKQFDQVLEVGLDNKDWSLMQDLKDDDRLELYITMPNINRLEVGGLCKVQVDNFELNEIEVDVSGASSCDLRVQVKELEANMSGAAVLELSGTADYLGVDLSGASNLRAYNFRAKEVNIEAGGASSAKVYARESIEASASGISNIRYKGSPESIDIHESGVSKIRDADDD
ncbi:GIN domain-containing protein [Reichenbachiella agariperforans]|uniref:GIN domain-containing protein n=1 Tax=Reichenbachiella agariperforans TaxID=156994 RepID=UPI001C08FFE7|nr:DUF2807 domain-containing protein [Reichenbachiella agariperforans]MBU2913190.1 DUF2807 domain-containing protein [Reichenbachiella agariperforans]